MNIKEETIEDLKRLKFGIDTEILNRSKDPTKVCYVIRLNNCESEATYFKNYDDAKRDFLEDVDFTVFETNNKYSIEPVEILETDYNLRPDIWYS